MDVGTETKRGKAQSVRTSAVNRDREPQQLATFPDRAGAGRRLRDLDASLSSTTTELAGDGASNPRLDDTRDSLVRP